MNAQFDEFKEAGTAGKDILNLPMAKATGFLCTKGFLVHLRVELTLVPQDFHGQTPYWCLSPCAPGSRRFLSFKFPYYLRHMNEDEVV